MVLRISKIDIKIIIVCSIIFVVAYLILHFDLFANLSENSDRPIFAKTVVVDNDVRMKSEQQFVWSRSSAEQFIRFGDQIFTGEKSNVVLELEDKQTIKIQENSLVKFEQKKNVKNFKIMFGSMTTQVKKGELIEVVICGEKIKIEAQADDEMKISNNDDCAKPEIQLQNMPEKVVLKPKKRQIAAVTKAIIQKVASQPVVTEPEVSAVVAPFEPVPEPAPPAEVAAVPEPIALENPTLKKQKYKFLTTDNKKKIEWSPVEHADSYAVKIYDTDDAKKVIKEAEVKSTTFDFKPTDPSKYSFSVQALTQDQQFVKSNEVIGSIEVEQPPIKIFDPEKTYSFDARTSDQKMPEIEHEIRWTEVPKSSYYMLDVATDPEFTNIVSSEKATENSFKYPLKEAGKLFYRVKAFSKKQRELATSTRLSYVEYKKNFDLLPPVITKQMKDQFFFFQKTQGQFIKLSWQNKQSNKAPNYYIEVAMTPDFNKVYRKYNSDRPYILLSESYGVYYWRVRSYGENIVSDWSETATLKIHTKRSIAEEKKD